MQENFSYFFLFPKNLLIFIEGYATMRKQNGKNANRRTLMNKKLIIALAIIAVLIVGLLITLALLNQNLILGIAAIILSLAAIICALIRPDKLFSQEDK